MTDKKESELKALLDKMCCEDNVACVSLQNVIDVSLNLFNPIYFISIFNL